MKIEVTDLSPVKKTLAVEVEREQVERETDAVLRRYASQVRLPGFRQGKAPTEMVRKRFAKEIHEDVRERLIARLFREATADRGLRPLGDPVLDELADESGAPFRFKTTFEVLPRFEVKDYRGVEARQGSSKVEDREVEEALESIRQGHARYVADEARLAEPGDVVVADLEERPAGEEARKRERMVLEVAPADSPDLVSRRLAGVKGGSALDFDIEFPEDYPGKALAGKSVHYAVQVHEVKRREVAPLDDELARDLGDFENLAALRGRVRADLEARKTAAARAAVRQAVLDKVLLANPVPLPDILVEEEIQHRLEDLVREMMMHGLDPRAQELDWKQLRDRQEEPARKIVHARLVLDAVALAEGVAVDRREVDERVRREADRINEGYDSLRARLVKGGGLQALETQMVREKTLDLMTSIANIHDAE